MLAKLMNHAWLQLHGFFFPSFNPLNAAGKVVLDDCRIYIKKNIYRYFYDNRIQETV